jgi:hypothetical protein
MDRQVTSRRVRAPGRPGYLRARVRRGCGTPVRKSWTCPGDVQAADTCRGDALSIPIYAALPGEQQTTAIGVLRTVLR